ncbi:MAG: alanine racemase [Candidatus Aminicenantes bacterium]|nr:MAG: alanine racemase [Candidatus Aminicenantes bacterium]
MPFSRREFLIASGLGLPTCLAMEKSLKPYVSVHPKKSNEPVQDTWIELNLPNMAWNLNTIKQRVSVPVMAVIKANAYGHGLQEVGRFLDKSGIDALMVCKLSEAIQLRESGVRCPILNFGPMYTEDADLMVKHGISQSIFTDDVQILSQNAQKASKKIEAHIHIDTGMGRMGLPYHKAGGYIEKVASLEGIRIQGISTTLTEDPQFDKVQMERFLSVCQKAEQNGIRIGLKHAYSSAGIFTAGSSFLDMVRPGILLYGYYPNQKTQKEDHLSLKPILQFKSRVAAVKILRPGDSVSYHRAYTAKTKEKMAVIPVGYSDGYPYSIVGKGWVLIKGQKYPLIGDITANHLEVRLDLDSPVGVGDEVILIGSQGPHTIFANQLADWESISTYKILLRLNPLLPRRTLESNYEL